MNDDGTTLAPEGYIWICLACGKTSKSKYGFDQDHKPVAMRGWDVSCSLNSQLFLESQIAERDLDGRVIKIHPNEPALEHQSAYPDTSGTS